MRSLFVITLTIITILVNYIQCLPQGAPVSACFDMRPIHGGGIPPLTTKPLFSVTPEQNKIGQHQILNLEISGIISDLTFKGFMIHARDNDRIVGSFTPSSEFKTIDCDNSADTATHKNTIPKKSLQFQWNPPQDFEGTITFNTTVAQDYDKFWVGIVSQIEVVKDDVNDSNKDFNSRISTTRAPLSYPSINRNKNNDKSKDAEIYEGCGESKTCFGTPDNCIASRSCTTFTSVNVEGDKYIFDMISPKKAAYIAVALSDDDKMGDDSVMECVNESGSIKAYSSWTTVGSGKYDASRNGVPQNIVKLRDSRLEDGMIYCRIERNENTVVNSRNFNLRTNRYYLLMASGSSLRPFSVDYHDIIRAASQKGLMLAEVSNVGAKSKFLPKLHGSLMVAAWLGATTIGILFARYFKGTWRRNSFCNKDIWFAWHRMLMTLTWLLTLCGAIVIVLEIRGWSNNIHAILGVITTAVCFIQAFIGYLRPSPASRRRPLFNWVHWLFGNTSHIFSIAAIFTAVKLQKAELPVNSVDTLLIVYVVVYVVAHGILSCLGCLSDRKTQKITSFPMSDMTQSRTQIIASAKQDEAYSGFRKFFLTIFIILILAIVIGIITIVILAPVKDIELPF